MRGSREIGVENVSPRSQFFTQSQFFLTYYACAAFNWVLSVTNARKRARKLCSATLRWLNTVFACALAYAIQRAHKYCIKTNMASIQRSFYLLNVRAICTILLQKWIQCIDGFTLYYKGMLEKVTMQRTQQFSAFVCYRKNPVKCSACVVSRKNCDWVKNWLLGDTPISREPLIRISRNLAQKYFRR